MLRPLFSSFRSSSESSLVALSFQNSRSRLSKAPARIHFNSMHSFVVYAPDKTDEGAMERRLSVRPQHLEGSRARAAQGVTTLAGATLTPESLTGGEKRMTGLLLIIEAEDLAAAVSQKAKAVDQKAKAVKSTPPESASGVQGY